MQPAKLGYDYTISDAAPHPTRRFHLDHERFIQMALELAQRAVAHGNHPFGALLVKDEKIVLTAENTVNTDTDCTRHAELNLVSRASRELDAQTLSQCTLYTSTEPCAMCAGAIYWADIPRVVYACSERILDDIAGGNLRLPCQEVFARGQRSIEVIGPILETQAAQLHKAFWPSQGD